MFVAPFVLAATLLQEAPAEEVRLYKWLPTFGVSASKPQKLGVSAGLYVALPGKPMQSGHHGPYGNGFVVEAEVATAGAKLSAGVFSIGGMMTGASARIAALRTYRDPWVAQPKRTYVGPEVVLRFAIVRMTAGYLRSSSDGLFTAGAGLGF